MIYKYPDYLDMANQNKLNIYSPWLTIVNYVVTFLKFCNGVLSWLLLVARNASLIALLIAL